MISPILCLLVFIYLQWAEGTATCIVGSEKDSAMLNCFFSEDISLSKKDFGVYRYNNNERQAVVNCSWSSDHATCVTKDGEEFNQTITDKFQLNITSVTRDQAGKYACEVKGSKPTDHDFCELSARKSTCQVQPVPLLSESNLICYFPEDISQSKKDFSVYHHDEQGQAVAVVKCRWLSDDLRCSKEMGYECDRTVSNITTVRILRVSEQETGKYSCFIAGSTLEERNFCELTLSTEWKGKSPQTSMTGTVVMAVNLGVVALVAISIVIVFVFFKCVHYRRRAINRNSNLKVPVQDSKETAVNMDEHPDKDDDEHTPHLGDDVQSQGKTPKMDNSEIKRGALTFVLKREYLSLGSFLVVTPSKRKTKLKAPVQVEDGQTTLELLESSEQWELAQTCSSTNSTECDTHTKGEQEKNSGDYVTVW